MVPHISFLQALAVGACVTPTDPVLSNSIVKGKFADKNIPKELQKIIVAESGANDGLGYPFLFLPLYLIQYIGSHGDEDGKASTAIGLWFGETLGYTIILSVIYGAVVGWLAKELLHWAEEKKYVDRESFLVFAITLALFIVGTVGMIGSDDVLACFIAGNTFTWDDWFRLETMDDSFQPTIDMLLNVSIFIWFGAICPWAEFYHNNVISIWRLVILGILVLLLRRPPIVFSMHKKIHQIEEKRQALFVGFFGPIGVSAAFYLYISIEFLNKIKVDGNTREDAAYLIEVMNVVIWFLIICSVVVHGLSIPLGKLGFFIPRTLSRAISSRSDEPEPFYVSDEDATTDIEQRLRRRPGWSRTGGDSLPNSVVRIGRSIIRSGDNSRSQSRSNVQTPVALSTAPTMARGEGAGDEASAVASAAASTGDVGLQRTIRFPDEQPVKAKP
ncbi:hypothetical protein SLS59_002334 [Nothophoma quercina]|uniref:Cation/H+ exchanger transmembrane domain-containing protein n=1 Tax=Nothophoma quercina TaxID=749835 RepID=A0ABR3RSF4_9PLEO